ncbi:MAG: hypothetical protein JXQ87_12485 [Bacteroidia bacterium]
MKQILLIILSALTISICNAHNTHKLFNEDLEQIESEFKRLNLVEHQIIESGVHFETPLSSSDFEIPLDSLKQDFPILGIPTFWLVFFPTCAGNCLSPCVGGAFGLTSVFYIKYFGKDEALTREAWAGCLAGQLPLFGYLALFILAIY